jgi:hypothetical protein
MQRQVEYLSRDSTTVKGYRPGKRRALLAPATDFRKAPARFYSGELLRNSLLRMSTPYWFQRRRLSPSRRHTVGRISGNIFFSAGPANAATFYSTSERHSRPRICGITCGSCSAL